MFLLLLLLQRAGYSLQELFMLSRSQFIQQRSLALSTLANILSKVRKHSPAHVLNIVAVTHLYGPVGACRWVHVCSERQCRVHAAGRRPGFPAALCAWRQCGGSDVCSGAGSQSLPGVCGGWGKATLICFSVLGFRCLFYKCTGFSSVFAYLNIFCLCQIYPVRSVWTAHFHGFVVWPPSLCCHLLRMMKMRRMRGCRKI